MGTITTTLYPDLGIALPPVLDNQEKYKILVINEDHWLQKDIRNLLEAHYTLCIATTVAEALRLAKSWLPELVITDAMVADGDNESLSLVLKRHTPTCHIPVVMLTDRDDAYSRIKSFYLGADDYIRLPIDWLEFQIRIHNLIASRKMLRAGYQRQILLTPEPVSRPSQDNTFLQRAKRVLEENLADPLFGSVAFARAMGMSQTCLYRRLMAVAGCSSNDFIRQYRLRRAADLLRQQVGNVGEVAYQVGFNSLSYFAKCFKQAYNRTPRNFARGELRQSA